VQTTVSPDQQLLLIPEIAAYARASVGTIRYWIATGKLASLKPGRRVMVRLSVLQKFLSEAERGSAGGGADDGRP
jgi:excisionase family DNA binding protein